MNNLQGIFKSSEHVFNSVNYDLVDDSAGRLAILRDGISFRYEPGNCTGYDVTVVLIDQKLLVAVPNFSACGWFGWGTFSTPDYVLDTLRLTFRGDAEALADLINGLNA